MRRRLAVMAAAITAIVAVCVAVLALAAARGRVTDYRKEEATAAALRVVFMIKRDQVPARLASAKGNAIQVLNPKGEVVASTSSLAGRPPMATFRPPADAVTAHRVLCPPRGLSGCREVVAVSALQPDGDWIVYAATAVPPWYVNMTTLLRMLVVSLLIVALAAGITWRAVGHTLVPVDAIRAELAEITVTDLGRRVPVPGGQDEIRMLAETVNTTLDRLEAAVEQMRQFTSDASHDLRSPITAMRTQVEEALLYPEDADWPAAGRAILVSLDRLQAIVTDLLTLAMLDAGAPQTKDTVDLARLVEAELERRPRAVRVVTDLAPRVQVTGDQLGLARLLTNLVDNAERHASSQVSLTVRAEGDMAVLQVLDDGAGIAPEQWETVFQRFTRLDASRSRDAGGTGLGLPIARHIAETHGGTLTIEESTTGARFVLRLPLRPR
ncbi:MAG TPA: HAMP domain-containing sensor histidine kinase [Streptosporangiaceae bacterium]|nr:HAMP domain-containing sensor histidine kinase [Streptosporangiaceae bacterium]